MCSLIRDVESAQIVDWKLWRFFVIIKFQFDGYYKAFLLWDFFRLVDRIIDEACF